MFGGFQSAKILMEGEGWEVPLISICLSWHPPICPPSHLASYQSLLRWPLVWLLRHLTQLGLYCSEERHGARELCPACPVSALSPQPWKSDAVSWFSDPSNTPEVSIVLLPSTAMGRMSGEAEPFLKDTDLRLMLFLYPIGSLSSLGIMDCDGSHILQKTTCYEIHALSPSRLWSKFLECKSQDFGHFIFWFQSYNFSLKQYTE